MTAMDRREALRVTGTAVVGAALAGALGAACADDRPARPPGDGPVPALSPDDEALATAFADTLLPATAASPGARTAGAGAAMNLLLTDCHEPADRERAVRGLQALRAACRTRWDRDFLAMTATERTEVLRTLDAEVQGGGPDPYAMPFLRDLALRTYFSSEVGMTQALRYERVPGRWVGCVPLAPGQPAWG